MVTLCENTDITDFEHPVLLKKFKSVFSRLKKARIIQKIHTCTNLDCRRPCIWTDLGVLSEYKINWDICQKDGHKVKDLTWI